MQKLVQIMKVLKVAWADMDLGSGMKELKD